MFKRFCSMIVAYNEQDLIRGCLYGLTDLHNYVVVSKPWLGEHKYFDNTSKIAEEMGAEVILKDFLSEKDERNFIMEKAKADGYDYVFIIDVDEFYTREDIRKAIDFIENNPSERYNVSSCIYFWKNENWEILPKYNNIIPACYRSDMSFTNNRNIKAEIKIFPNDITMYHFSYAGSDEHILSKLQHFSHAKEMRPEWFDEVWKKWTPEMEDIHPGYNKHAFKKAIPYQCPEEIKLRFLNKI